MSEENGRDERLARLDALVGEWRIDAPAFPLAPELAERARMRIEWALGGAFLQQTSSIPVPEAPDGLCLIGPDHDGDGYTQHYFDSRGIARLYAMRLDGRAWTLERRAPDFTPLAFEQRWISELSADGRTIAGRWEIKHPGRDWELDFELVYTRV